MPMALDELRRHAVTRSLFSPTTLKRALERLGFVQADPIRAPARAQDLVLRHRVSGYRAGDLERRYETLDIHEDFFINYGFVTGRLRALMHPRTTPRTLASIGRGWTPSEQRHARRILAFVRQCGEAHPRDVEERFSRGTVINYWGGSSNATTRLLDDMHYRGLLRVVRREGGVRVYAAADTGPGPTTASQRRARLEALADAAIRLYAPLPSASLAHVLRRLQLAAPQWRSELPLVMRGVRERLTSARVDGVEWYWPSDARRGDGTEHEVVRLMAPFDPVVWDRRRFELLWGWSYRFEAYTPPAKRKLGYYALPLLWRDRIIGWGNLSVEDGELHAEIGYHGTAPRERSFKRELAAELDHMRMFLGLRD
ncbi:MAG TPA: crosslink repair DNA glycosylase YcaQ family protein [Spirochaetia bacterium]